MEAQAHFCPLAIAPHFVSRYNRENSLFPSRRGTVPCPAGGGRGNPHDLPLEKWRVPHEEISPLAASLASATLFGLALLFIKQGMAVVNQDTIKFWPSASPTGFVVMTLLLLFKVQKVDYAGKPIGLLLLCGLLNPLISQILETTSTSYAPTSLIACVSSITPILVVVLSVLINKDPRHPKCRWLLWG